MDEKNTFQSALEKEEKAIMEESPAGIINESEIDENRQGADDKEPEPAAGEADSKYDPTAKPATDDSGELPVRSAQTEPTSPKDNVALEYDVMLDMLERLYIAATGKPFHTGWLVDHKHNSTFMAAQRFLVDRKRLKKVTIARP